MGEIDDIYKEESENLESDFLEKLKGGGNREDVIKKFLENSAKSRQEFQNNYKKSFSKERLDLLKKKGKRGGNIKFDYLEVKHFEFEPNFFDRVRMKLDLLYFRDKRFLLSKWGEYMPEWSFYYYYKIKKNILESFKDVYKDSERALFNVKNWLEGKFAGAWEFLKKIYIKISYTFSVIFKTLALQRKDKINEDIIPKKTKGNNEVDSNEPKT